MSVLIRPTMVLLAVAGLSIIGAVTSPETARGMPRPFVRDTQQIGCAGGSTTITPCGTSADTLLASGAGERSFIVSNTSETDHTYAVSCATTVPLDSCAVTPSQVVVPAGGTVNIALTYSATTTIAPGGVVTVAVDGGALDQVATVIAVGTVTSTAGSQ